MLSGEKLLTTIIVSVVTETREAVLASPNVVKGILEVTTLPASLYIVAVTS